MSNQNVPKTKHFFTSLGFSSTFGEFQKDVFFLLVLGAEWKFVSSGSASYSPDIHMSSYAHNRKRSPAPWVRSEVSDFVLQGGGDLLQAERQLPVLGGRVLVQRLDDLRNKMLFLASFILFLSNIWTKKPSAAFIPKKLKKKLNSL